MGDGGGDDEVDKKALKFSFNQGSNSTKRRKRDTVAGVSFADDGDGGSDDDGGPGKKGPQQITSFDGQASQENAGAANARRLLTIPAQPNTYREGKRYVPSFVPEQIKTEELEDMKPGDGIDHREAYRCQPHRHQRRQGEDKHQCRRRAISD